MAFKVYTESGLCDRLRVIFSYQNPLRQSGQELVVCWQTNEACPGQFLDLFEPIPGITFTTDATGANYVGSRGVVANDPRMRYLLHDLRPLPYLQDRIAEVQSRLPDRYAAVHVRRTDKLATDTARELTRDEEFFAFLDGHAGPVFLACDNAATQHQFQQRYGDRLVTAAPIVPTTALRQTDLAHAVVDLFVCAHAYHYLGTNLSGYSILVEIMQQEFRKKKR